MGGIKLAKGLGEILKYGVEGLSGALKENLHTKEAFKEIAEVIGEASSTLTDEESEGRINIRQL